MDEDFSSTGSECSWEEEEGEGHQEMDDDEAQQLQDECWSTQDFLRLAHPVTNVIFLEGALEEKRYKGLTSSPDLEFWDAWSDVCMEQVGTLCNLCNNLIIASDAEVKIVHNEIGYSVLAKLKSVRPKKATFCSVGTASISTIDLIVHFQCLIVHFFRVKQIGLGLVPSVYLFLSQEQKICESRY